MPRVTNAEFSEPCTSVVWLFSRKMGQSQSCSPSLHLPSLEKKKKLCSFITIYCTLWIRRFCKSHNWSISFILAVISLLSLFRCQMVGCFKLGCSTAVAHWVEVSNKVDFWLRSYFWVPLKKFLSQRLYICVNILTVVFLVVQDATILG